MPVHRRCPARVATAAVVCVTGLAAGLLAGVNGAAAAPVGGVDLAAGVVPLAGLPAAQQGPLSPRLTVLSRTVGAGKSAQSAAVGLADTGPGSLRRDTAGRVLVDVLLADSVRGVTLDPAAGFAAVRRAGLSEVASAAATRTITGWVTPALLPRLAAAAGVRSVSEVLTPMSAESGDLAGAAAVGSAAAAAACRPVRDEADTQLQAARARAQFDVDGSGVTVGVLSDSYAKTSAVTTAAQDVAAGELPGAGNPCGRTTPVKVVDDSAASGADEGRAMLQHVHDLAPGSTLAFATAFNGLTSFADNVTALVDQGARVLSDDVTYFAEPFFQAGPVDAAIARAKARGATFFSSAANNNIRVNGVDVGSYEAPAFRPTTTCGTGLTCHDFNAGSAVDANYGYAVPAGSAVALDLQWDEPWYGVTTDLDLLLTDSAGTIVASSRQDNIAAGVPFEYARWANTTGSAQAVFAFVVRTAGTGTPRLKTVELGNGAAVSDVEYRTPTGNDKVGPQIFGHNGGANVVSTAAVPYSDRTTPEVYSSPGPVTLYHGPVNGTTPAAALRRPTVLAKPDVSATDGAATSFFGQRDGAVYRFYGTSAASPHAAAVAALMKQADPSLTPAQIAAALEDTAARIRNGLPRRSGAGLVDAYAAVQAVLPAA